MKLLREKIPSVPHVLEGLHAVDTENSKLGKRFHKVASCNIMPNGTCFVHAVDLLHRLLHLESEYKPLPGFEPALNSVLIYLQKVCPFTSSRSNTRIEGLCNLFPACSSWGQMKAETER